jgi:hypothetical protein
MNGQFTFQSPSAVSGANVVGGEDLNVAAGNKVRMFTATERVTIVEVGVVPDVDLAAAFAFDVLKRIGGTAGSDGVISLFTAEFAAEGGPGGDPSIQGFDEGNKIPSGIVTNTLLKAKAGKALRAYCEVSLDKGDQIVFRVSTANGTAATGTFYAKAYPMGAGLVENNDVDSN